MTAPTQPRMPARHASVGAPPAVVPPGAARHPAAVSGNTSRMFVSRLIGALFIAGFVTYGVGSALVTSVVGDDGFLARVPAHQTTLVLGAFLMLLNTAVDIGKAVLIFPVLDRWGRRTALTYLGTMVFEVALMAVGILALLMLVPLADQASSGQLDPAVAQSFGALAVDGNELAYQVGQMSLGFGAMFLCLLFLRSGLVPRALAMLGLAGYALHMSGAVLELLGVHLSFVLLIPGGLFEVSLAVWLLVKGFKPEAFGRQP
jgi:uncharacterized protein DUF4386